ncbi:MAG: hypothetical protein ABI651_00780 [Verrucomicrobiota bacterium]
MRATKNLLRAATIVVLASILTIMVLALLQQTLSSPPSLFAYVRVPKDVAESSRPTMGLLISNAGPATVLFRIRSPADDSPFRIPQWDKVVKGEVIEIDNVDFEFGSARIAVEGRRRCTDVERLLHHCLRATKALIGTHNLHFAKHIYKSDATRYEFGDVYELVGAAPEWVNRSDSTKVILVKLVNTGALRESRFVGY